MANDTTTLIPDGTWTYTGDVSLVSSTAKLTADLDYDIDSGGADVDLSLLSNGDPITGWTTPAGALTKEAGPVMQQTGAWGGSYRTTATVDNIMVKGKIARTNTSRNALFGRFVDTGASGYQCEVFGSTSDLLRKQQGVNTNMVSQVDFVANALRTDAFTAGDDGDTLALNMYTESDGNIRLHIYSNDGGTDFLALEQLEFQKKYGAGTYGVQTFGTIAWTFFKVFLLASGTAEVTATPDSVTSWIRIDATLDGYAEARGTCKLSQLFEYKMTGGGASPAVFTTVPDTGDISAAVGDAIVVKLTTDNRYKCDADTLLRSISVEIDGEWTGAVIVTPDAPTSLVVTSQNDTDVVLTWVNGANTTALEIMRATVTSAGVTGAWTKINDATVTGTTYTDNAANSTPDPTAGVSYAYSINPLNGTTEGDWSNIVFATFVTAVTRIPGDFEDDLAGEFIITTDFGEAVTWTKFGGSPVTINVMYDAESTTVDPDTGEIVTSNPLVTGATKDLEGAGNKDTFTISGQVFRVREVMPDGSGLTVVTLTKGK